MSQQHGRLYEPPDSLVHMSEHVRALEATVARYKAAVLAAQEYVNLMRNAGQPLMPWMVRFESALEGTAEKAQ